MKKVKIKNLGLTELSFEEKQRIKGGAPLASVNSTAASANTSVTVSVDEQ